ncbi:Oidioi.mRNA.OKI2018_I69.chr2.g7601.t1.cds [Oikopleura dioica]|uniref:Oidioi.mRNA.OKI2018_I69.chr2.g7601.t1.cds n=1 Tax=Oikopleura dioica TaxID=34765 RepID=A0ABN7TDH4_OIKDI|nr:Oidioi.mRNA.OKI2018_I69.chr2.g7601.t1.cds [Oikopleura dioica]
MFGIVNQLKSLSLRPVRSLSATVPVSNRLEKRWTERRTKRRQLTRLWKQNSEYFEEKWHQNYSKEIDRKKDFVASIWKSYGLEKEPEKLSIEEKEKLIEKYTEQGVWNAPLTYREVLQYQTTSPTNNTKYQKHKPTLWRKNYQGLHTDIPLERMVNPLTGEKFTKEDLNQYYTEGKEWELEQKKKIGELNHENRRHSKGWVSMRDSRDFDGIEVGRWLPLKWACHPSRWRPVHRPAKGHGKTDMNHVLRGYWESDFPTNWRFNVIKSTDVDTASTGLNKPPIYDKDYVHGWSNPENWRRQAHAGFELKRRQMPVKKTAHLKRWKQGR